MDKNTFGAIVASSLLNEGLVNDIKGGWRNLKSELKSDKPAGGVAGAIGTGLGKAYNLARQGAAPLVGAGLQHVGTGITKGGRKVATGIVQFGGKIGKSIDDKTLSLGRKTFYKGLNLREKYKK